MSKKNGKVKWIGSVGIFSITLLSFWTQYFGLFFILPLALVTVAALGKDKRMQELWAYIRTMFTAAVVGVCVYPFAIGDVLFSSRGAEALSQWQNGLAEYFGRLKAFGSILAKNIAGSEVLFLGAVLIPAAALVLAYIKLGKCRVQSRICAMAEDCGINKESALYTPQGLFMMCAVPAAIYFLLAAKMSPYFVDRYIMAIFPVTALIIVLLWDRAVSVWTSGHAPEKADEKNIPAIISVAAACILTVVSNINMQGQHTYLYTGYGSQLQIAKAYKEYPLVCLYQGSGFYENVMEMEQYTQTMLIKPEELASMDESRVEITKDGYVVLIKYPGAEAGWEQLEQVMEVFGGAEAELLYEGGAYGDVIYFIRGN